MASDGEWLSIGDAVFVDEYIFLVMSSVCFLLFGLFTHCTWEIANCGLEYGVMLLVNGC